MSDIFRDYCEEYHKAWNQIAKNYLHVTQLPTTKRLVREALDNYNRRVARHLASYMGWPEEEILYHINNMPDNKRG